MIPQKIAMGYILTGRHMTAQEAHRLGVVNEVVPLAELMPTALKWADEILECAPLSIRASKQASLMGLGPSPRRRAPDELHRGRAHAALRGHRRGPARLRREAQAELEGPLTVLIVDAQAHICGADSPIGPRAVRRFEARRPRCYTVRVLSNARRLPRGMVIMDNVEFDREPPANLTTMVMAFGGWIDAGRAATGALRHLVRDLPAARLARIDPEEFFVFTQERPEVRLRADGGRDIQWPRSEFFAWHPGDGRDGLLFFAARSPTRGGRPIRRRSSMWPSAAG